MKPILIFSLIVLLLASACAPVAAQVGDLQIENPRIRATLLAYSEAMSEHAKHMPVDPNAPLYLRIANTGTTADRLIAASTPIAAQIVLVEGGTQDSPVRQLEVPIPADGKTSLEAGGLHLLLVDISRDLTPDMTIPVTLVFENAGEVTLEIPAKVMQPLT